MKSLNKGVEVIVLGSGSYAPPSRPSRNIGKPQSVPHPQTYQERAVPGRNGALPNGEGSRPSLESSRSHSPSAASGRNYPVRNPSGYVVNIRGEILIFDFGSGSLRNLARAGMNFMDISHIFITHFHIDHWLDILSLLFLFHFVFKPKSGLLTIAGPAGTKKFLGELMSTCSPYTNPTGYRLIIREIKEGQPFSPKAVPNPTECYRGSPIEKTGTQCAVQMPPRKAVRSWTVRAKSIRHCKPSLCYRLEYYPPGCKGRPKSITYTGDASYERGLVEFAKDSDILITDCTLPGPESKYGHMTLAQAVELARRSGSRKTVLSHVSPKAESAVRRWAGKYPDPSILVGRDLMKLKI